MVKIVAYQKHSLKRAYQLLGPRGVASGAWAKGRIRGGWFFYASYIKRVKMLLKNVDFGLGGYHQKRRSEKSDSHLDPTN